MNRSLLVACLAVVCGVIAPHQALAQTPGGKPAAAPEPPKRDPKSLDYEKAVKDLKRIDGAWTLYIRKKEILLELPESKLGQMFTLQATFNTGVAEDNTQAGFPVNNVDLYSFEKGDDTVYLVQPTLSHRWSATDPYRQMAERSFPKALLNTFRVEQTDPERKVLLVNVSSIFNGDTVRLPQILSMVLGGPYMLDRDRSSIGSAKGFPDNTVVRMNYHFSNPQGGMPGLGDNPLAALFGSTSLLEDRRSAPVAVTYNVTWRKESNYVPRLADPRVGYFTTDYWTLDKFFDDEQTRRVINRWNLKKKDPFAAISEPVKPIVWTLDPAIPKKWRPAVRDAVLRWNAAFEKIGFKNAVQVQEVDNDPDYDHADQRYNTIRWTMSENAGYAIALFRTDPITGEIISAGVNFDATMLSFTTREHREAVFPILNGGESRAMEVLTHAHPENDTAGTITDYLWEGNSRDMKLANLMRASKKAGWSPAACMTPREMVNQARFGYATLQAMTGGRISPDEYARQFITDVISHEVGHCMGLRHNYVASNYLTTAQLGDESITSVEGNSSSVMDYVPVNTSAILRGKGNFYSNSIGVYDKWAIEYGYSEFPRAGSTLGEVYPLSQIAAKSGLPGHAFLTDDDINSWDAYTNVWDNSKDPINYSLANITAARKLLNFAIESLPRTGESYTRRTDMILMAVSRIFRESRYLGKMVGGLSQTRNFKGDQGERRTLAPVPSSIQRQAAQQVIKNLLKDDVAARIPTEALQRMTNGTQENTWDAPVRRVLSTQMFITYSTMMGLDKLDRIGENEFKMRGEKDMYTLDEHFATVLGAVFSEVGTGQNISPNRRDLQRFAVNGLIAQAGSSSEDVKMLASDSLRRLSARFGNALAKPGKVNGMTLVHLRDTKEMIDRYLERKVSVPR
ncbi:MAG: zinc-dependent metalloprotease [Armatimonadetes bacterium]|nr:zinc-dependent metalloprotease [Armatimonadota bacterium]